MGRGQEPWEQREAGGVNDNEWHLHQSPVSSPTEELRKDKRRSSGRAERTRTGLLFVFCVRQSSMRGCRFTFVFGYFVIKVFKCLPVPASFFPIYKLCYIGDNEKIESDINLLHIFLTVEQETVGKFAKLKQNIFCVPMILLIISLHL